MSPSRSSHADSPQITYPVAHLFIFIQNLMFLGHSFYILCVLDMTFLRKVKISPERNISSVRVRKSCSTLYTTDLEKKTVYSPRVSYIFQYFRRRSSRQQLTNHVAERPEMISSSSSSSLSLSPLFSIPLGPLGPLTPFRTNNAAAKCASTPPQPATPSSYSSP